VVSSSPVWAPVGLARGSPLFRHIERVEDFVTDFIHGRYAREFLAGWGTMDFNGHMANTSYLNLAADARMAFFAEHGFPPSEFRRLAIGPVMKRDEVEYFREVGLNDTVTVTYAALAMSADGARFVIENEIWSASGERAATVRSTGGWLDLRSRKLVAPPPDLFAAFAEVPRAPDFVELPSLSGRARDAAAGNAALDERNA
jgi:acyl-CoA thioester hydrolase